METNQPTKLKAQVPGAGSHLANATFPFDFVSSPYFWWLFSPWPPAAASAVPGSRSALRLRCFCAERGPSDARGPSL